MQLTEKTKLIVRTMANNYLAKNTLQLTSAEQDQFNNDLDTWLLNDDAVISDNLREFLVDINMINDQPQVEDILAYLRTTDTYRNATNVLEIGNTRTCPLGVAIAKDLKEVTVVSPNIRLTQEELRKRGVYQSIKKPFDSTMDLSQYDVVIASIPHGQIQNIIDACKLNNKPFYIALSANEKATTKLDGYCKVTQANCNIYTNDLLSIPMLDK